MKSCDNGEKCYSTIFPASHRTIMIQPPSPVSRGGKALKVHRKLAWDCGEPSGKAFFYVFGRDEEEVSIWDTTAQDFSER